MLSVFGVFQPIGVKPEFSLPEFLDVEQFDRSRSQIPGVGVFSLDVETGEFFFRHDDFSPTFAGEKRFDPKKIFQLVHIRGDVFADHAVASCQRLDDLSVRKTNTRRIAVEFILDDDFGIGADELLHFLVPSGDIFFIIGVFQRKHRSSMRVSGIGRTQIAARRQSRRIEAQPGRMLLLDLFGLFQHQIELLVGNQ